MALLREMYGMVVRKIRDFMEDVQIFASKMKEMKERLKSSQ